jgi:hypothetical protein
LITGSPEISAALSHHGSSARCCHSRLIDLGEAELDVPLTCEASEAGDIDTVARPSRLLTTDCCSDRSS